MRGISWPPEWLSSFQGLCSMDFVITYPWGMGGKCNEIMFLNLTPWSRVLIEKLIVTQLINNFFSFYGNRNFITVFITLVPILSQMHSVHTSLLSPKIHSHLRLGFLSTLPFRFSNQNVVYISPMRATWPAHPILLDLIILTIFG
jgi:hypothetical protein